MNKPYILLVMFSSFDPSKQPRYYPSKTTAGRETNRRSEKKRGLVGNYSPKNKLGRLVFSLFASSPLQVLWLRLVWHRSMQPLLGALPHSCKLHAHAASFVMHHGGHANERPLLLGLGLPHHHRIAGWAAAISPSRPPTAHHSTAGAHAVAATCQRKRGLPAVRRPCQLEGGRDRASFGQRERR